MYVNDVSSLSIPSDTSPLEYDLLKRDWLPPHGSGKVADISFHRTYEEFGVYEIDTYWGKKTHPLYLRKLIMRFPGDGNGVISQRKKENRWHELRMAPIVGYQNSYEWFVDKRDPNPGYKRNTDWQDLCFYVRIRAEKNERGELKKALYGKMLGVKTGGKSIDEISFCSMFNPTCNDRNLEYDYTTNLFKR